MGVYELGLDRGGAAGISLPEIPQAVSHSTYDVPLVRLLLSRPTASCTALERGLTWLAHSSLEALQPTTPQIRHGWFQAVGTTAD